MSTSLFRSHRDLLCKGFQFDSPRRQRALADELATFDEERQLARRQLHAATAVTPQRRKLTALERLDLLLDTGPSPNGLVMDLAEERLLVAMTRDNAVWRLPLMADGTVSKVGRFIQLSGGLAGPDGMALDAEGGLWVADAGHGSVWGFTALGVPRIRVVAPEGLVTTNLAFRPGTREVYITQSDRGEILRAALPVIGKPMFSHA